MRKEEERNKEDMEKEEIMRREDKRGKREEGKDTSNPKYNKESIKIHKENERSE